MKTVMRTRDRFALARRRATPTVGDWVALLYSPRAEDRYWAQVWEQLNAHARIAQYSVDAFEAAVKTAYEGEIIAPIFSRDAP